MESQVHAVVVCAWCSFWD